MLSEKQKRHLRRLAHPLNPVVTLGNAGLTDAVVKELERALHDHELVKVKARAADRKTRDGLIDELARRTGSEIVQRIGHIAALYRANPELAKIMLPD